MSRDCASRILKDDVIAEIISQHPNSVERLGQLRSVPKGFERSRAGEQIVEAVKAGLARDPKTLPRIERDKPLSNGASATVELLKVLLRMTSEQHGVAAKVIATVDDLEQIAADEEPEVQALRGWRRELFGEKALALKSGRLALAMQRGRVIALDRPGE
jgi:ribonuclease D